MIYVSLTITTNLTMYEQLEKTVPVDAPQGFAWLSWAYRSCYLPDDFHGNRQDVERLFDWFRKGLTPSATVGEVQMYALAMGLTLRDMHVSQFLNDDEDVPDLPFHLPITLLTFDKIPELEEFYKANAVHRPRPAGKATQPDVGHRFATPPEEHASAPAMPPTTEPTARTTRPGRNVSHARPSHDATQADANEDEDADEQPDVPEPSIQPRTTRSRGAASAPAVPDTGMATSGQGSTSAAAGARAEQTATRKRARSGGNQAGDDLTIKTRRQ